jgi:hypothetical protein
MVTLDLLGSGFSLLQILMDSMYLSKKQQNKSINNLNLIKLLVATTSLVFDFTFLMQHCIVYKDKIAHDEIRMALYNNSLNI